MDINKLLKQIFSILLINLIFFLVIPGIISKNARTYSKSEFTYAIDSLSTKEKIKKFDEVNKELKSFANYQDCIDQRVSSLEEVIMNVPKIEELKYDANKLIDEKNKLQKEKRKIRIKLLPFIDSPNLFLWWTVFSALMILICLRDFKFSNVKGNLISTFFMSLAFGGLFALPFIYRQFWLDTPEQGRVIYSFQHFDVSRLGFAYQMFTMWLFGLVMAVLIHQCNESKSSTSGQNPGSGNNTQKYRLCCMNHKKPKV